MGGYETCTLEGVTLQGQGVQNMRLQGTLPGTPKV